MNGPQNSRFASFSQDRQNPGQVQKKSVARFRTGPKYTARCMDVQLGVWKVVPRAEMFVHGRCCWLGFVAQKRFTCPRKKSGLNRARTPFSADIKSGAGRVTGILSQSKSSTNLYKYCMNWAKEDSSANAARVHEPNHGRYIQT